MTWWMKDETQKSNNITPSELIDENGCNFQLNTEMAKLNGTLTWLGPLLFSPLMMSLVPL